MHTRIATAGLAAALFFAAQAQAKPTIVWSPRSLAVELTAGETKTYTLSFAANLDQKNLDVRVVPGLAGLVTVTPARFPSVAKGVEQQVEITVHAPALEEAKTFEGILQLRSGARTVAQPLPLTVAVQPDTNPLPGIVFYGETTNPLVFSFDLDDGSTVDVQGVKDATTGVATTVTSFAVTSPDGSETIVTLDDLSRPAKAFASDGTAFEFEFVSATQFVLTIISADGTEQVQVPIDIAALATSAKSGGPIDLTETDVAAAVEVKSMLKSVQRRPDDLTTVPVPAGSGQMTPSAALAALADFNIATAFANVQQCGAPVSGALLRLQIVREVAPKSMTMLEHPTGSGRYFEQFVNFESLIPPGDLADVCEDGMNNYVTACEVAAPIAASLLGGGCVAAGVFSPQCFTIAASIELTCLPAQALGPTPSEPVAQALCAGIVEVQNFFTPDGATLIVTASHQGATQTKQETVPSAQAEVNFGFEFPAETSILKDFVTSPADPAPFQGYVGTGTAQCLADGANLSISISGSDGYSDATSCPPGDLECQLGVPGAEENVVDTLRFSASDGPTRTITRTF